MMEEDRQRAIRLRLARMQTGPDRRGSTAVPTGFTALDRALGAGDRALGAGDQALVVGGLPRSRITELFGPSSSGKTTLLLQTIAHLQSIGLTAAWIDADRTYD